MGPIVIEDQLDSAKGHGVIERHTAMTMPTLDHPGKYDGEIHFAELLKKGVRAAEHAHDFAALVGNLQQGDYLDAFDHAGSSMNRGVGMGTAMRPPRRRYSACCSKISSAKFQGRIKVTSGCSSKSASELRIG